ncbi:MAG: ribonuclease P protein component [Ruminococcaceae bacterium]|nr:ribonuclease P protein component [Oscillospiraceae bacterium]
MGVIISLDRDGQFQKLYKKGKSFVSPALIVYVRKNGQSFNRLGITASKKIGKAVVRNRAKRRIRELYRTNLHNLKTGYDFVIVARTRTADFPYNMLLSSFLAAMKNLGVLYE